MLKHVFLAFGCLGSILSWGAFAQTTVTLTVDMSNETVSPDGVHVAGNFQGWDPGATPMTDNGDGTWSHTFTSDTAATYHYKFINGNAWGSDEGIPDACAVDGNRQIEVDGMMGELESSVCFNSCNACGVTTVLFRVDMSNEDVSPFGVHIMGDFQGWDAGATPMIDDDGDFVYEYSHTFEASETAVQFIFINGNSLTDVIEFTDGECTNEQGIRELVLDSENITLSANDTGVPYCFNQCTSCVLPLQVTFTVDMSVLSSVSEEGVHLAGSFQGWDAESTMLTDNGDGTWSTTLEVAPGAHEFKFINGRGWNGGEENMNGTSCSGNGNRAFEFDADNNTYQACFNICPGESCLPDPDPANLTFQVDASEVDLGGESIFIFGAFTGWQGGAIEMTDNGDGTWQTTQLVSGSANVDYLYSIGVPSEGNDESGSYVLAGDSTTFEMGGCGVPNGFGRYNRRFVRSGVDEVVPLHCYNSCSACLGDGGCTDSEACNYDETAMTDDGSCIYVGDACDDGNDMTINDMLNEDCICVGESAIFGCTDPSACNYDPGAEVSDGSCCNCDGENSSSGSLLYFEDFDAYNDGDAITEVSSFFQLWPAAGATDAYVSNEASWSGAYSLKLEGQLAGGPMDVVLSAGVVGIQDVTIKVLVPAGYSGYYNVQESVVAGVEWAFECNLGSDGNISFAVDLGAGGPEITAAYNYGNWIEIKHVIDTDADRMNIFIDGIWIGELPYDGEQFGGLNFYAFGDGVTLPLYYVDDISVTTDVLPGCSAGCTDTVACNYSPSAIEDDGSCDYSCLGCTDSGAINYDSDATVDDGTCVYFATSCEFIGHPAWAGLEAGLYSDSTLWHYQGAEAYGEWVLHMPELVVEPASGANYAVMEWSNLTMSNMPPGLQPQNMPSSMMGGEQVCVSYSGVPSEVGLYPVLVSGELTVTLFGNPYVVGPYNVVGTIEVLPNPNPIAGCTYGNAANYVVYANVDDGSCVFAGCTETEACNYQPLATVDDGTCDFGVCETVCPADVNGDGTVNTNDLLGLLGYFGLPCEE